MSQCHVTRAKKQMADTVLYPLALSQALTRAAERQIYTPDLLFLTLVLLFYSGVPRISFSFLGGGMGHKFN